MAGLESEPAVKHVGEPEAEKEIGYRQCCDNCEKTPVENRVRPARRLIYYSTGILLSRNPFRVVYRDGIAVREQPQEGSTVAAHPRGFGDFLHREVSVEIPNVCA